MKKRIGAVLSCLAGVLAVAVVVTSVISPGVLPVISELFGGQQAEGAVLADEHDVLQPSEAKAADKEASGNDKAPASNAADDAAPEAPLASGQDAPVSTPPDVTPDTQEPANDPATIDEPVAIDDHADTDETEPTSLVGWVDEGGARYYVGEDGETLTGLAKIAGALYYFDADGRMCTGWQTLSGRVYCFGDDGKAAAGWAQNEGKNYYLGLAGYALTGLQKIDSLRYYFDKDGVRQSGLFTLGGRVYAFAGENDAAVSGWYPQKPAASAANADTNLAKIKATAEEQPGAAVYYFGPDGYALTGLQELDGGRYGFDEATGAQLYGWQRLSGRLYYFAPGSGAAEGDAWRQHTSGSVYLGKDGAALTGLQQLGDELYSFSGQGFRQGGWVKSGGVWYCFDGKDNSALRSAWVERAGGRSYLDADGKALVGAHMLPAPDGGAKALYLFDADGLLLTGWQKDAEGRLYLLDDEGRAQYGWQKKGADTYYYIGDGGYALTGLATIEGKVYGFSAAGVRLSGVCAVDGRVYGFFEEDGAAVKGEKAVGASLYYFGDDYAALTGFVTLGDDLYLFSSAGVRQSGWQQDERGLLYYFSPGDGKAATGWFTDIAQKAQFYFGDGGYALTGEQTINGMDYRFDEKGRLAAGTGAPGEWVGRDGNFYYIYEDGTYAAGLTGIDGELYAFGEDGARLSGWYDAPGGRHYYFGGEDGQAVGGWLQLDGSWYYFGEDGAALTGLAWLEDEDGTHLYYLDEDGTRYEGEKTLSGARYLFGENGRAWQGWHPDAAADDARYYGEDGYALTGVAAIGTEGDAAHYWFDETGARKGGWLKEGAVYAFLGENDAALTGAQQLDGKWYLFGEDGVAVQGLYRGEAGLSFYDAEGVRQVGWVNEGARRYWFSEDGMAPQGLTQLPDGHTYYFSKEGYILTGTVQTPDGWTYELDPDGRLVTSGATEEHGWRELDGQTYYMDSTGDRYTGLQLIDGGLYYLLTTGEPLGARQYGWQEIDGDTYLFGEDGRAVAGWYVNEESGLAYYLDEEYKLCRGLQDIGGVSYPFDETDGHLLEGDVPRFDEWGEDGGGVYYFNGMGQRAVGLETIDGGQYCFDKNGYLQTGMLTLETGRYWFDPENGGRAATGWQQLEGVWYSFHQTGGYQLTGWQYRVGEDGARLTHYYNEDGTVPAGFGEVNGVYRYFFADGHMATGWQEIDGGRYYFAEDGHMVTGVCQLDGAWFSFDAKGRQITGFNTDMAGRRYYFAPEGMLTGWNMVDGVWYLFSAAGVQQTGWQTRTGDDGKTYTHYFDAVGAPPAAGWGTLAGMRRYFFADGHMGAGFEPIDGKLYYFYSNGTTPSGPAVVDGVHYPFAADGSVQMGWHTSGGARYYLAGEGALRGWQKLDGRWVLFGDADGKQKLGWQQRTEKGEILRYYFDADGSSAIGWRTVDGIRRYFLPDGHMAVGWQTIDSSEHYFDKDGKAAEGVVTIEDETFAFAQGELVLGWSRNSAGARFYFTADGALRGWQKVNGRWYCFDNTTGAQKTGWLSRTSGGSTLCYYYDSKGALPPSGWTTAVNGYKRYVLKDGTLAQGWMTDSSGRYYLGSKGIPNKGWTKVSSRWYNLDSKTGVQKTGWQTRTASGKSYKYYYSSSGKLPAAGWSEVQGKRRYVLADGQMAQGWRNVGAYRYYFKTDGAYTAGKATISGKVYRFTHNGHYIKVPTISKVSYKAASTGTKQTVTVKAATDTALVNRTLKYSFDGGKTWQTGASKSFAANTKLAAKKIQVKDVVGNVTSYNTALTLKPAATTPFKEFGIDVSVYQGNINWKQVKAAGVKFAIVRSLTWSRDKNYYCLDPYFEYNVRQAKLNGVKVGTYLYSYAFSKADMKEEIDYFYSTPEVKRLMSDGIYFDLPVYIDYEDPLVTQHTAHLTKAQRTDIVRYGMDLIKTKSSSKHMPGFYSYYFFLKDTIDGAKLDREGYEVWVADYRGNCLWEPTPGIWQYSSTGGISGIPVAYVDRNYCYKDYSKYINPGKPVNYGSARKLTVTNQNGVKVTDTALNILSQIVMGEVGGFSSKLTAAQATELYKAQAVAAQTFIFYQNSVGVSAPQVYLKTPTAAVQNAVYAVLDKKMTYNGGQVCAVYFASASTATGAGKTNNSAYWGSNLPYLKSVASPETKADVASAGTSTGYITNANLKKRLEQIYGAGITSGKSASTWIKVEATNSAGYVTKVNVCGRYPSIDYFYQTIMRGATTTGTKLDSPSFKFSYDSANSRYKYTFSGSGHGIGMSQWGAYKYAKQGLSYSAILKKYYSGVVIATV